MNVTQRLQLFNADRDPLMLGYKYAGMRESPFRFLRGTAHLFAEDVAHHALLHQAPTAWQCGDAHLENFGSYRGDNRLTYFDQNDFDEGFLGPCLYDVLRLATSALVALKSLNMQQDRVETAVKRMLTAHAEALALGEIRWVERERADGLIGELLQEVATRKRKDFLKSRTEKRRGDVILAQNPQKMLPLPQLLREQIVQAVEKWAETQENPRFYQVLDLARRIAGTGSLGTERYILLVEGRGSAENHFLLDMKEARPTRVARTTQVAQPVWPTEAGRVLAIQRRLQARPPALLAELSCNGKSFWIKELQPSADKIELKMLVRREADLDRALETLGQLGAWASLRSAGRQRSATADDLMDFAQERAIWLPQLLELANEEAARVAEEYREFSEAYDAHEFGASPFAR